MRECSLCPCSSPDDIVENEGSRAVTILTQLELLQGRMTSVDNFCVARARAKVREYVMIVDQIT